MSAYREQIAVALAEGWRFADLHGLDGGRTRTLLVSPEGALRLVDGEPRTIVDLAPAAAWDEREAADLYGARFEGHEPLRPLVAHTEPWTVPVRGHDPYEIAVGPIHAGVIESGHFRFHVVGERILLLDARLFYKHRGLERAAVGHTLEDGLRHAARACGACAVTNAVAYAHACEEALGLRPTGELARVRTIVLELERVWSHLNDIAAVCAGCGLAAGNMRFLALSERARRLNATLTGHRLLYGAIALGGSALDLDAHAVGEARREVEAIDAESRSAWREILFNGSFQDRLPDIGVVTREDALALGATGPAARASGVAEDVRAVSPRLAYDGFVPVAPRRVAGDVRARLEQRAVELPQSLELLHALLDCPVRPASVERGGAESATGAARVESPRGATVCVVERDGDRLVRLRLRTGSYANWPVVAHAAAGDLLPDFPLVNKSFELCYACADR